MHSGIAFSAKKKCCAALESG